MTKRDLIAVDERVIANQPNTLAAFNLMQSAHGLSDKIICTELPTDKSQWSKIGTGSAHFPMNKFSRLMDICGSEAFLQRLNWERGYEMLPHRRKSQLEKALEEETKRADAAELENRILLKALRGNSNG